MPNVRPTVRRTEMAKAHKIMGVKPLRSYRENARIILSQKVEEVYTWEPFIQDAARREELHNMRISIKRLRYTMELFRLAYGSPKIHSGEVTMADNKRFTEFLKVIVDLQEILGDIHDCDVVLEILTDYGTQSEQATLTPGIAKLITQARETRNADYKTFLAKWEQLSAANFKHQLLSFFGAARKPKTRY
ncbi:CHAD domain-containing protein [Candidatus Poribacteria bacterium]|nr:CHAD domain-containing protein [Candidatus Poribacteria bacterium]MYB00193.1 CHAD domain-containing protein [Candidatus Poribacteria bacterium]